MSKRLCVLFQDQIGFSSPALAEIDKKSDIILMGEVMEEMTYVKHHKQKLVLWIAAMRHFAKALEDKGYSVFYVKGLEKKRVGCFTDAIEECLKKHKGIDEIVVTEAGEFRQQQEVSTWEKQFGLTVKVVEDSRFLCTVDEFKAWAEGKKSLLMEHFYRMMRKKTGYLMGEDKKPEGGKWNYDKDNRKRLPDGIELPRRYRPRKDPIVEDAVLLVERVFGDHFGTTTDFVYGVTEAQAKAALKHFIEKCLAEFGDYQDAMSEEHVFLNHGVISMYMNMGLLTAEEVCVAAENAFYDGEAPLNAVEGFIRQIIGWREYIRGIYWHEMPGYEYVNYFDNKRPLPEFYWTGQTDMNCMRRVIESTEKYAYSHHIQRLMVTGNFALIAGLLPADVHKWYLIVYADAYEWVELPNTVGMALYADGGVVGTKPYACSGNYINKMSDFCKGCKYNVKKRTGPDACPMNSLYWDFLMRNEPVLRANERMRFSYMGLDKLKDEEKKKIRETAKKFLESI